MSKNIREFLQRVLPWPSDDEPGYINVHCQGWGQDGSRFWTGSPTRDVDQFLQEVHKALGWRKPPDIYMCMSRQGDTKPGKDGKVRAAKSKDDALYLKSIFLDIDVKPTAFKTLTEAVAAVQEFCTKVGICLPTAMVGSGGGLHCHWISDRPLTPDEWQPYANGLKAAAVEFFSTKIDAGVTGDSARVLRIPGTYNFKLENNPRPVRLLGMGDHDLDFVSALAVLPTLSTSLPVVSRATVTWSLAKRFAAEPVESLAEGIGREPLPPLDWKPLIKQCGWFTEAVTTGGKDFSQGLWNLSTLAATFLEDGHALAHRMAKGHPGYNPDETEALWERKLAERADRGLGWPACRSIQGEGCTHCATCPHLALGKTPLHLARVPTVAPLQSLGTPVSGAIQVKVEGLAKLATVTPLTNQDLPQSTDKSVQYVMVDGIVNARVYPKGKGGEHGEPYNVPLFHFPIYRPYAKDSPDSLVFITQVDKEIHDTCAVKKTQITSFEVEGALLAGRASPTAKGHPYLKDFIMSFLTKLSAEAAMLHQEPFGWVYDKGLCQGFCYAGVLYKNDGTEGPMGRLDPEMKRRYGPCGNADIWRKAFRLINDQRRQELSTVIATSFAAPLLRFTGYYNVTIAVNGDSGASKSSAARVACGVWGSPVLTKEVQTATQLSVIDRLGQIRNLPYYWDEISSEPAMDKAYLCMYVGSGGADGSRLSSSIEQRAKKIWSTITGIFSNPPFSTHVIKQNPQTDAGLMRLIEWTVPVPATNSGSGRVSKLKAETSFRDLDDNFGMIGVEYSKFLGLNEPLCKLTTEQEFTFFEKMMEEGRQDKNNDNERFWIAFGAATMAGAILANQALQLDFDLDAIRNFLIITLRAQRNRAQKENMSSNSYENVEQLLSMFLNEHKRNQVFTSLSWTGRGAPGAVELVGAYPQQDVPIHIHWMQDKLEVRVTKVSLARWLNNSYVNGNLTLFGDGLRKFFHGKETRGSLGAGTQFSAGTQPIWIIPCPPGSFLHGLMMRSGVEVSNDNSSPPGAPEPGLYKGPPQTGTDTEVMFSNPDCKQA